MNATTQKIVCVNPDKCPYRVFGEICHIGNCPTCPDNAANKEYDIIAGLAKARAAADKEA